MQEMDAKPIDMSRNRGKEFNLAQLRANRSPAPNSL